MKNTDEIDFWFFGQTSVSKPAVLGLMFLTGAILGFILGRSRKRYSLNEPISVDEVGEAGTNKSNLSEEDREYIS